jgi:hypothetical protein
VRAVGWVDVQEGQVAFAQRDQVPAGAQVGLGVHGLAVSVMVKRRLAWVPGRASPAFRRTS